MERRARVHGAGRAVESENRLAASVHHVEDDAAPSAFRVCWFEHLEVSREVNATFGVARGQLYVRDSGVIGMQWVNREMGGALEMIVSPHFAERLSAREWSNAGYVELGYWQIQIPFL